MGKTTLIKLKIRELLRDGINPYRIFYWACDMVDSYEDLTSIIADYIDWAQRLTDEKLYLFLDEVSAVRDWQKSIKYLNDVGKLKNWSRFIM